MTGNTEVYPSTIEERNDYYTTVQAYLAANASRLGVTLTNLSTLNELFSTVPATPGNVDEMGWQQLWALYANKKVSRSTNVIDATNAKDIALQHQLTVIYNDIPVSKWTPTDRNTLGRKGPALGHKSQSLAANKSTAVNGSLEPAGKNKLLLRVEQAEGQPGVSKKREGKDPNVREYLFFYNVQAQSAALPTTISQCTNHEIITRLPHHMPFDPSQGGMRCCGFIETIEKPAKKGAISPLISAIIPA
jgi:hypothetical protein